MILELGFVLIFSLFVWFVVKNINLNDKYVALQAEYTLLKNTPSRIETIPAFSVIRASGAGIYLYQASELLNSTIIFSNTRNRLVLPSDSSLIAFAKTLDEETSAIKNGSTFYFQVYYYGGSYFQLKRNDGSSLHTITDNESFTVFSIELTNVATGNEVVTYTLLGTY